MAVAGLTSIECQCVSGRKEREMQQAAGSQFKTALFGRSEGCARS